MRRENTPTCRTELYSDMCLSSLHSKKVLIPLSEAQFAFMYFGFIKTERFEYFLDIGSALQTCFSTPSFNWSFTLCGALQKTFWFYSWDSFISPGDGAKAQSKTLSRAQWPSTSLLGFLRIFETIIWKQDEGLLVSLCFWENLPVEKVQHFCSCTGDKKVT